jgi:hypothetical protein
MKSLPRIVGKDGAPGRDGRDGADGRDGTDGISFGIEDLESVGIFDPDARTMTMRVSRDGKSKDVVFPNIVTPIYRGAYKSDRAYEIGDQVTYGGAQYIALVKTMRRPDEYASPTERDWQLCVKKGFDGKNGKDGAQGPPGKDGRGFTR